MTLLGALLVLAPRPLYPLAHGGQGIFATALLDQQLGGTVMLAVGGVSYLLGGLWLTAGLLRDRTAARRDERSGHVYRA
jgi:putative membrane protein